MKDIPMMDAERSRPGRWYSRFKQPMVRSVVSKSANKIEKQTTNLRGLLWSAGL